MAKTLQNSYHKFFDLDEIIKKVLEYNKNFNQERFKKAFIFAAKAHDGQMRKDGHTPYIAHPVAATQLLTTLQADEDTLIAALLHDVPEDTKHTIEEVEKMFGKHVGFLVDGITKLSKIKYKNKISERESLSLKKLLIHSAKDLRVLVIKLADRAHNMSTLQHITKPEKRIRIAKETLEIYVPIAHLLGLRDLQVKLENLCFKHICPTEHAQLKAQLEKTAVQRNKNFRSLKKSIVDLLEELNIKGQVIPRIKNLYTIYRKITESGKTLDKVDDRIGIRVVVNNVEDCYRLLGAIHLKYPPLIKRFKDYIASPKANGYQSLHTTVFGIDGVLTEFQIRTKKMNNDATLGIASYFLNSDIKAFKNFFSTDPNKSLWLKRVIDLNKDKTDAYSFLEGLKEDILERRMIVKSYNGKSIDLPKGSTGLDFAYAVSKELGNKAYKIEVNGKVQKISDPLKTRDVVKVITKDSVKPNISWLSFVKTTCAKKSIVECHDGSEAEKIGRYIIQDELDLYGFGVLEEIKFKNLRTEILNHLNIDVETKVDFYRAVGLGQIKIDDLSTLFKQLFEKKGSKFFNNRQNCVEEGVVTIKIFADDRFKLMQEISDVLYRNSVNMLSFKGSSLKSGEAYFVSKIKFKNENLLRKMHAELEQIDGVKKIFKIRPEANALLYPSVIVMCFIWALHPFFIMAFLNSNFYAENLMLGNIIVYSGILALYGYIFYLTHLLVNYFPIFRTKKTTWLVAFLLPMISLFVLEVMIQKGLITLNPWLILGEFIAISSFLYLRYQKVNSQT
jgi:GTP pyrophosphokinase